MPGDVLKTHEKPSEPYSEKKYTERGTVMIKSTYEKMKQSGITFDPGMTEGEFSEAEGIYRFRFPESLREFLSLGIPTSGRDYEFPKWRDFSAENAAYIKQRMQDPFDRLKNDIVKNGFWLPCWGEKPQSPDEAEAGFSRLISGSPKLIPVFGHRYMPLIGGCDNPPVISTVGRDTIFYGAALEDYLETEFICREYRKINADALPYIPVWTDIIQHT